VSGWPAADKRAAATFSMAMPGEKPTAAPWTSHRGAAAVPWSAGVMGEAVDRGTGPDRAACAREPAEVLQLACAALTDGDQEAAVALYEPDAALSWSQGHTAAGHAAIRRVLAGVMDLRLPVRARAVRVLSTGELALITGERTLTGTGLDGVAVTLTGPTAIIARCQPDGTWLTAADDWVPCPGPGAERGAG
jgi:ketosteroid isomerase-like protein